jgi:hypothetical protein
VSEPLKVGTTTCNSVKEQKIDKPNNRHLSNCVKVVATIPASEVKKSANVQQPLRLLLKTQLLRLKQTLYVRYFLKKTWNCQRVQTVAELERQNRNQEWITSWLSAHPVLQNQLKVKHFCRRKTTGSSAVDTNYDAISRN